MRQTVVHRLIAGHGDRGLGDRIPDLEVRVGYGLRRCDVVSCFVHILDRIAQCLDFPVRVHLGVRGDLGVPVEQRVAVRRGVPAVKDIAGLFGVAGIGDLLVLVDSLAVKKLARAVLVHKLDGEGRRDPLGVQSQIVARHLVKGVRVLQSGICVPAAPRIVAVIDRGGAGRLRRGIVISRSADIRFKVDIVLRVQLRAAEEVFDLVLSAVIIEVIAVNRPFNFIVARGLMAFSCIRVRVHRMPTRSLCFLGYSIGVPVSGKGIANIITITAVPGIRIIVGLTPFLLSNRGVPGVGIAVVGTAGVVVMLGITVDVLRPKIGGIQADLRVLVGDHPRAVRLLQPVIGVSVG